MKESPKSPHLGPGLGAVLVARPQSLHAYGEVFLPAFGDFDLHVQGKGVDVEEVSKLARELQELRPFFEKVTKWFKVV